MAGKRKRRHARTSSGARKARVQRQIKQRGHADSRRYGERPFHSSYELSFKGRTFEEEYQEHRKSRGRRGLNPDPTKRPYTPPGLVIMGTFPIGELMSKPIRRAK